MMPVAASIPPLYYFLHLCDKSPRHRRLSPLMPSAFFRESITWPRRSDFLAQLYADRDLSCASRFSEAVRAQIHVYGGQAAFYLADCCHALNALISACTSLRDETRRKNAVHRYFWRRLHAIHTVLLRRDLSCSQSNSYEFRKSIARDLQLIVVSRLCNCSGRESQRSPLRLPSFYKTKALNQPTQSGDWRVRSLVHSPDRVINL